MSELYMPDSPNGGYRRLAKTERVVSIADDGELFIVRHDDVHERVVRCKDCAHMRKSWNGKRSAFVPDGFFCAYWGGHELWELDGYCKWGDA